MSSSPPTGSQADAEELSQLSRLLFDRAAARWYSGLALEFAVGIAALILGVLDLRRTVGLYSGLSTLVVVAVAYALRLSSENDHDAAETMRRQSVLSEGLGWAVEPWQLIEWRRQAGTSVVRRLETTPRAADYYSTQLLPGAERLLDMTLESSFYTRNVYERLRSWLAGGLVLGVAALFIVVILALSRDIPASLGEVIGSVAVALVLLLVSLDFLGVALSLSRTTSSMRDVEKGLNHLRGQVPGVEKVMRLVAEYNCQVVAGVPILSWIFKRWHDDIRGEWERMLSHSRPTATT